MGYFSVIADSHMYEKNSHSRNNTNESDNIIVIYYDLKNMVDGDFITLKNKQRLYAIGTVTNNKGYTFRVYSFYKRSSDKR